MFISNIGSSMQDWFRSFLHGLGQVLLFIWQLPQNLVGLLYMLLLSKEKCIFVQRGIRFYIAPTMNGGVSLGMFVFISDNSAYKQACYDHEFGHCRQSRILGPLYLPTVGLCSGLHCVFHNSINGSYYDFWTERWANKLGGVPSYAGSGAEEGLIYTTYAYLKERMTKLFG